MNCDDAFDALTDPDLANTGELAEHLAKCPRCRDLKQVLEPALSLLCGDLPAEPAMAAALPNEGRGNDQADASRQAFLSVEAIGVAEAAAARLASLNAPAGRPVVRLPGRRFSGRPLRGALCAAFGGLAVFCLALWYGKSDVAPQPSLVPVIPAGVCTRNTLPRRATKTPENARAVILSCVACHLREQQPRSERLPTSLFQSPRRAADAVLLVRGQTEVVNHEGPIPENDYLVTGRRLGHGYA
jgi:cytochrome c553